MSSGPVDELTPDLAQKLRLIEAAKAAAAANPTVPPLVPAPPPAAGQRLTAQERIAKLLRLQAENDALRADIARIDEQLAAYALLAQTRAATQAAAVSAAQQAAISSPSSSSAPLTSSTGVIRSVPSAVGQAQVSSGDQPGTSGQ